MDYDNDGARDLFLATGMCSTNIELYRANAHYAEPKLMFRNYGRGVVRKCERSVGTRTFQLPRVSRGAAVGDFDNDGDLDILVSKLWRSAAAIAQRRRQCQSLVEILLIGTKSNREWRGRACQSLCRRTRSLRSAQGRHELPVGAGSALHFGLGAHADVDAVEILWPSGMVTKLAGLKSDQIIAVKRGEGIVQRPFSRALTLSGILYLAHMYNFACRTGLVFWGFLDQLRCRQEVNKPTGFVVKNQVSIASSVRPVFGVSQHILIIHAGVMKKVFCRSPR